MALREVYQMMLADYKKVTDEEKAVVVQLGGLHVLMLEYYESGSHEVGPKMALCQQAKGWFFDRTAKTG
eukprot:1159257-Pelagomonas_calceolata.AAC.5